MIGSFMHLVPDGSLLWQLDVDEFWRPQQVRELVQEFRERPDLTAAWFDCDYFFGWDRCSSRPGHFGNFRAFEWLRVWRYRKGDRWESHEPPRLIRNSESENRKKDVGRIKPLLQEETRARGWKFQHYAMADRAQMEFKEVYYGHRGLVAGLDRLERAGRSEPRVRRLFSHIRDKEIGTARTPRTFWKRITEAFQPGARAGHARTSGVLPIAQADVRGDVRFVFDEARDGQPATVLLIRADRIGDQILFLPFLASLRKQLPATQIHLAVPEDVAPIYRRWGEVDRLHTFRREEAHRGGGYRRRILQPLPGSFDWVLLPAYNGDKASYKLAKKIHARRKVAFAGEFRGVQARHRAKYEAVPGERVPVPDADLHELQKYQRMLVHLGLKSEIDGPCISLADSQGTSLQSLGAAERDPTESPMRQPSVGPRIVMAVGTVNAIKEYPHWPDVVKALNKQINPEWVLIGGPAEKTSSDLLQTPLAKTRDLRGKTSLEELARVIASADLFLGVDTGPAHLALALQKPTVVVLGGGDYGRFFPYGQARVVTHPMACFQCHWECKYERALCLHDLSPKAVVREVLEALKKPA